MELVDWWNGEASFIHNGVTDKMNQSTKRLAVCVPEGIECLTDLADDFDSCIISFFSDHKDTMRHFMHSFLKYLFYDSLAW